MGIAIPYRNEFWLSRLAFAFGAFALFRSAKLLADVILRGTIGGWIRGVLEIAKLVALGGILWRIRRLNRTESDADIRTRNLCAFNLAVACSLLFDVAIGS